MQYTIYYPTSLDKIENLYNDNIDVCVQVKRKNYTFVVATIENLKEPIWLDKKGYVTPAPILIVEKLTKESIEALLEELFKDKTLVDIYGKDIK